VVTPNAGAVFNPVAAIAAFIYVNAVTGANVFETTATDLGRCASLALHAHHSPKYAGASSAFEIHG